ncbi:unnamed protein product, partial [Symbiodinium sp. CCMP2456]
VFCLLPALADALQINVKVQHWQHGWSFQELLTCYEAIPLAIPLVAFVVVAFVWTCCKQAVVCFVGTKQAPPAPPTAENPAPAAALRRPAPIPLGMEGDHEHWCPPQVRRVSNANGIRAGVVIPAQYWPQGASPIMRRLGLEGKDYLYVSMNHVTQHRGVEWSYVMLAANEDVHCWVPSCCINTLENPQ